MEIRATLCRIESKDPVDQISESTADKHHFRDSDRTIFRFKRSSYVKKNNDRDGKDGKQAKHKLGILKKPPGHATVLHVAEHHRIPDKLHLTAAGKMFHCQIFGPLIQTDNSA